MLSLDASVRALFTECQNDPVMEFEHRLRLARARQLRELMSDPQRLDVPTFEREVWRFGATINFQGHKLHYYEDYRKVSRSLLDELLHEIETGAFTLHGNYMFQQPINTLDPGSSDTTKAALLQEALRILNDPTLAPREKVHRIMGVRGFGAGNATALVCFMCPEGYPVCNKRSAVALEALGYLPPITHTVTAEYADRLADIAHDLKEALGARDYFELDTFLDLLYSNNAYPPVGEDTIGSEDDEVGYPEGKAAYRAHIAHERNHALVQEAKRKFKQQNGHLFCQVCTFDFGARYGELGADYIEAHHIIPVSQLSEGDMTLPSQLAMVCSNCHRMLHRGKRCLTIEELARRLASVAQANAPQDAQAR